MWSIGKQRQSQQDRCRNAEEPHRLVQAAIFGRVQQAHKYLLTSGKDTGYWRGARALARVPRCGETQQQDDYTKGSAVNNHAYWNRVSGGNAAAGLVRELLPCAAVTLSISKPTGEPRSPLGSYTLRTARTPGSGPRT